MGYILLVEAHAGLRNWCQMHLSTGGHEVSVADDARRALKLARTRPPELVAIATDLAGSTAYALAATLRAEARTAEVPILFLAPADDAAGIAQASAIAPGNVLTKPLTRDVLLSAVAQRLEGREHGNEQAPGAAPAAAPPAMLTMESKTVSVLVVTLRNLVSLARSLRGRSLDALIQRFLTQAREAVVAQGGWVVRIDATGLLAVFENSPHQERNHASVALEAALRVMAASRRVKQWAGSALRDPSLPNLSIGCGVHSGEVVVARLPLDGHLAPSLAGVTVDIANRLNGRAKGLGWSVAVSEGAALLAGTRFEFGRRATLTDTDHDITLSILECLGFHPGAVMPEDLPFMAEVREAVEANTVLAQLAGDVDPNTADRTIMVAGARRWAGEAPPELPDRRIERRLGQGNDVTTYLAIHLPSGRREAVKTIPLDKSSPEFVERYLDIYQRVAGLNQPHVVAVREVGRGQNVVYVTTEHLQGPAMGDVVRKRVAVGMALNLLYQMCRALDAVHGLGLYHGALRAEHFAFRDERTIVLTDLNASVRAHAALHADTPDCGEPRIPELDHYAGVRADLRSAGLILLAMLSAEASMTESALVDDVTSLPQSSRLPMQLSSLQPLLDRLLGLEGSKSFDSASEVLAELPDLETLWSRPAFPPE